MAYDADPASGLPVYDTVKYRGQSGWFQVGGTSAGAPQWAAFIAIVNSGRAASGKPALSGPSPVYSAWSPGSANFHDVTSGTNGSCGDVCTAALGYDYVTGLGTPVAAKLYSALVAQ